MRPTFLRVVRVASLAIAACDQALAAETASPVGAGSVLQVLLGLALVLGMVFLAAWAMRRFNPASGAAGNALRVVGGTSVGNRERVLLIEVGDTWLVVGVAPGRVSQLHNMPKPADSQPMPASSTTGSFATWLKQTLERRGHG